MRRKLPASLVAVVVALPITAFNVPALAATSTQSEAEAEDLALIAEQRGITLEEAQALFGWQEQFVEIAKLRYYRHGTSGSNYTNVTRRDSIPYRYGDATWYSRGAYTPSPTFYYNWDMARDVTSVKRPILDQNICRFGRTTGRNCSTPVWVTDVCARDYCDLVATTGHTAENGDSGGPWFLNTTAYGVHKGWKEIADKRRSIFTEAANFPYMDVSVLTR
ncbi:trypsin-like serine protease [Nonomuraea purpurea]|uniref:Trypsin-like serine protease n=1 Tax=Nonomuraea purpurea TaxID=1849276 RepID=A0ABV8G906_9ACTN